MNETGLARRVTLADVAQSAGVSRATASRALNDDPRISPATRRAVRQAADQLRYVPNAAARSLRVRRTRTLGLLVADFSDPFHGQVAAGFELEAAASGYTVLFVAGFAVPVNERRALKVFVEHGTDGVALAASALDPVDARGTIGHERVVFVQPGHRGILSKRWQPPAGTIQFDDAAGVEAVVTHLLEVGYREIAYLGTGASPSDTLRRSTAERAVRQRTGTSLRVINTGEDAWQQPQLIGARIEDPLPEAIICYDDKLALTLLHALRVRGVRVPEDVAVVGFDGIPFAAVSNPGLTTVNSPTTEMGRLAARTLVHAIQSGEMAPPVLLPVELVVRESSVPNARTQARNGTRRSAA